LVRHIPLLESLAEVADRQMFKLKALNNTFVPQKRGGTIWNADDFSLVARLIEVAELRRDQKTQDFGVRGFPDNQNVFVLFRVPTGCIAFDMEN